MHVTHVTALDGNEHIDTAGTPTENAVGIPTGKRVKLLQSEIGKYVQRRGKDMMILHDNGLLTLMFKTR